MDEKVKKSIIVIALILVNAVLIIITATSVVKSISHVFETGGVSAEEENTTNNEVLEEEVATDTTITDENISIDTNTSNTDTDIIIDTNETDIGEEEGVVVGAGATEHEHIITSWTNNGDGTHSGICTICTNKTTENHTYVVGECSICRAKEPVQTCIHEYEIKNDADNHWEECTKCGDKTTKAIHEYGKNLDNGDGSHSTTCIKCANKITQNHTYVSGKCSACGATEPVQKCVHKYVTKNDAKNHWEECTKCGDKTTKAIHEYGKYSDNKNGTHSSVCTKCNYKITESHNVGGQCKYCGLKDNTTTIQKIPQTGVSNAIIIAMSILTMALIAVGFKLKQYKDI